MAPKHFVCILVDPVMKWNATQALSRTNTKILAYPCDSPCEKLHFIAQYCTYG